jgi:hypothetical protein
MGIEVGIKARLLWAGGVLVDTKHDDYAEAIRRTKALIADPTVPAIFEAALVHDNVLIRVDALERLPDRRWRLNEVKSSTRIKDEHLEDVALQGSSGTKTSQVAGNAEVLQSPGHCFGNSRKDARVRLGRLIPLSQVHQHLGSHGSARPKRIVVRA